MSSRPDFGGDADACANIVVERADSDEYRRHWRARFRKGADFEGPHPVGLIGFCPPKPAFPPLPKAHGDHQELGTKRS